MAKRIRLGIDGCGTLTTETILAHLVQDDFQKDAVVAAVADVIPERAQRAAEKHQIPRWHASLDEMLDAGDLDAILIIVPHRLHAEHALKVLRAGLHAYIQKPMAPTLAGALEIVEEAERSKLCVVAAPGQCLWPLYDEIRKVIEQGEIGQPYLAIPPLMGWGGYDVGFPSNPSWFYGKDAGPLRDHGGYGYATLSTLFGPARRVSAFSATRVPTRRWNGEEFAVTGHDNSAVLLDFGDGMFAMLPEAWCDTAPAARVLRVHGLEGCVQTTPETFNHLDILPLEATVVRMGRPPLTLTVDQEANPLLKGRHPDLGHLHVYGDILHLVDCIQSDRPPLAGARKGAEFVALIDAAFRSAETGAAQPLPSIG